MNLVLARLVFEFDFELEDEEVDWMNQRVFTLWEKPSLMIRLRARKS
jgi:hypothetical protein